VLRVLLLDLVDLAEVRLEGTIRDELDVVEAERLDVAVQLVRAEAGGDVLDGGPERLPDGAAPAGVERALDLAARVRGRRAREPEGVGRDDAAGIREQARGQIKHVPLP
jgi:hypothetical protein